jgi:predicted DNA-binding transcriptional regulator AlpA
MEDLLTIEETSELLRTPVETLRHWRKNCKGPVSAKLGRRVMYRRADVLAWVDAQFDQAVG